MDRPILDGCQVAGRSFGDFGCGSVSWIHWIHWIHGTEPWSDVPPNRHDHAAMLDVDIDYV